MSITLLNQTRYPAIYLVLKDQKVIVRQLDVNPHARAIIPVDDIYEVSATTLIDGNTYTSAPMTASGGMGFLAQVLQSPSQEAYDFDMVMFQNVAPNQLAFQKTCLNPVTFTISKNGKPLQNIVVTSSFQTQTLDISNTFSIHAVINGVTTDEVTTSNPKATVTAVNDTGFAGYYLLEVS
ncbi:hypothetical protein [Pseudomonas sp. MWU12-2037]|uniref:hypothetical protein n=1 Tax=Pseudomonas sp. MWU12-2037 TaxID=2928690 RepID=UPI002010C36B|nr:hypothetical protein [Pseudomonas sp. MWU12-2037]